MKQLLAVLLLLPSLSQAGDIEIANSDSVTIWVVPETFRTNNQHGMMMFKSYNKETFIQTKYAIIINTNDCIAKNQGSGVAIDAVSRETLEFTWDGNAMVNMYDYHARLVCEMIKHKVRKINV